MRNRTRKRVKLDENYTERLAAKSMKRVIGVLHTDERTNNRKSV